MASLNKKAVNNNRTHEGASSPTQKPLDELKRSVLACLLWEDTFYESGENVVERIKKLIPQVNAQDVCDLAIQARTEMNLRHVPLLLVREMARYPEHKKYVRLALRTVIQRPDELAEFLTLYWKENKCPLSGQVKKGLADAFTKFNEYSLAKYNRDHAIKLRDVLFMVHAKPKDEEQASVWKRLVDGQLTTPDTWEVALSSGQDKKETWERLMRESRLGALAFLRNLRNMREANVDQKLVKEYLIGMDVSRVLPYRFIAAARYAPELEPELERCMLAALSEQPKLPGKTGLLIDVSGSMDCALSKKSDLTRLDAACGLAILLREMCEEIVIYTFSNGITQVPPRHGFALRDAIVNSQPHSSTYLGQAVKYMNQFKSDRTIVITDEQSSDEVYGSGYMINVGTYQNGVGYGNWTRITGFSEQVVRYISEYEKATRTDR